MTALTLLVTSPRVPAGVLSRDAWRALEDATIVLARDLTDETPAALASAGITIQPYDESPVELARHLLELAATGQVVWVGSADADPGLTDALASALTASPEPAEVEILVGSWDLPGARLLDAVAVVDALLAEGGDPWSAQQTHASLANYLIEEAHETVEAIDAGEPGHLAEELGDVLFQVILHSRIAAATPDGFDIDQVAGLLVAKLLRRNPHVFGDAQAASAQEVEAAWEQIKAAEKPARADDLLDGIPAGLSTLLIAEKVLTRAARRGLDPVRDLGIETESPAGGDVADGDAADIGDRILALTDVARQRGESADALVRAAVRAHAAKLTRTGSD